MEKENDLIPEQETKDTEIVELKDEDMSTITAGSKDQVLEPHNNGYDKNKVSIWGFDLNGSVTPKNACDNDYFIYDGTHDAI